MVSITAWDPFFNKKGMKMVKKGEGETEELKFLLI
jgi:hypothetical protein